MPLRLAHPDDWVPIQVHDPALGASASAAPSAASTSAHHGLWWLVWSTHHRESCHGMGILLLSAWLWVLALGTAVAYTDSCAYPGAAWVIPLLLLPILLLTCGGTSWPLGGHRGSWLWVLLLASLLAAAGGMALLLPGGATPCSSTHTHTGTQAHTIPPEPLVHPWA